MVTQLQLCVSPTRTEYLNHELLPRHFVASRAGQSARDCCDNLREAVGDVCATGNKSLCATVA
jgi:hypothetical protein